MLCFRRFLCSVLAFALLAVGAQADFKRINKPNPDDPMAVAIYRLDNGLTVYLSENHESPRFQAEVAVRVGSKNDPDDATGLAHYFEHLMFKGSPRLGTIDFDQESKHLDRITALYEKRFDETDEAKRAAIYQEIGRESQAAAELAVPNELQKVYGAMGGSGLNAHTGFEETVFMVGLPSNRLRQWARVEADRFSQPIMRLFQTELETVYEEKNGSLDNKGRLIFQAVFEQAFKKHPYGRPILGTVEHLKNPSIAKIVGFFDTWYVPNNMAVIISGDIDADEAIVIIDEAFGSLEEKRLPRLPKWKEKAIKEVERVEIQYPGEEQVLLAFRTADQNSRDADALALFDMTLDNSVAGLINLNLNQAQRVRNAGAFPYLLNDYGSQYFSGVPKKGQTLEEVEALLVEQIELVKRGEIEDWILPAIITDFKKNRKGSLESNPSRVALMRSSFISGEKWKRSVEEIERLEKLGKRDIVKVANKFFDDGYVAGYRRDGEYTPPKIEKPPLGKIAIDASRHSAFADDVLAMKVDPIEPTFVDPEKDYSVVDDKSGVRFYHSPNPINDLFSLTISVDVGTRQDNRLNVAASLLQKSGTPRFTAEELKKEWYKLGTNFALGAGADTTNITIAGLDENFEASVALMMELLTKPQAAASVLDEQIRITLGAREDSKKNPDTIQRALLVYNRLGKESSFLKALSNDALQKLTVEELNAAIAGLLKMKQTISYTGSRSVDDVIATVKRHHSLKAPLADPPAYKFLKARAPKKTEIYFHHKDLAQAQVRFEFGCGEYDEKERPASLFFDDYFGGGMSGLVFQELRESRALAYMAGARFFTGAREGDENLMVGVVNCQPDKVIEAADAFIDLFDNLPVSEQRFETVRASLLNRYRTSKISFRGVVGAVRGWERLGLEPDPRRARFESVGKANIRLMTRFHKKRIGNQPKLISITGDKSRIDMEALARIGKIVEIDLDELFAY